MNASYQIVKLANGSSSIYSLVEEETFHPVVGPVLESEGLYVRQLNLQERVRQHAGEFVVWDVGLGAAANPLAVLRATREIACPIRLLSFDNTVEPLRFALGHLDALGYLAGYESQLRSLLENHEVTFEETLRGVNWTLHVGDFPTLLTRPSAQALPKPHAILFDAFSPAKNPEMWTQPLFARLFQLLDSQRPCAMPTYSRSTMLRVSLLLAGFYVGAGHATGEKEETTIAANTPGLLTDPLDESWLQRARRSTSAEPLWEPVYRQARLAPATWERLQEHPQFTKRLK